jgi:60 kDa SS-A/Ro ribonucleoprotein
MAFRGWGRSLRTAVADWYQNMPIEQLAYQSVKYVQREGWSNRDALRLTHPKTTDPIRNQLYKWIVDGEIPEIIDPALHIIQGAEVIKKAETAEQAASVVSDYRLPREAVPTQWIKTPEVQKVLALTMPMTARIRNLGNLSKYGILTETSEYTEDMVGALTDRRRLEKARIHPMQLFSALKTYGQGHGVRSSWPVIKAITDALEKALYLSFGNIRMSGKRICIAIDVSGSMSAPINGMVNISCSEAAVAMALPMLMMEPNVTLVTFDKECRLQEWNRHDTLATLAERIANGPHGGTDCAQPIIWAQDNKAEFDAFILLTDHETWAGKVHPYQVCRHGDGGKRRDHRWWWLG